MPGETTLDSDIDIIALVDGEQEALNAADDAVTDIVIDLTTKYNVLVSLYSERVAISTTIVPCYHF